MCLLIIVAKDHLTLCASVMMCRDSLWQWEKSSLGVVR